MLDEKKKIMNIKLKKINPTIIEKLMTFSDNTSRLYFDIIKQTTNSIWWHCTSIILQYLHLLFLPLSTNVSFIIIKYD